MREPRLGDIIDDYCVRCKRMTNHSIVSILNTEPAKMRCRSCYSDHDYRHEKVPPSRKELKKEQLFKEVLAQLRRAILRDISAEPREFVRRSEQSC